MSLEARVGEAAQQIAEIAKHWQALQECTDPSAAWAMTDDMSPQVLHEALQGMSAELQEQMLCCWRGSDYVAESSAQCPDIFIDLLHSGDLQRSYVAEEYSHKLSSQLAAAQDEDALARVLRRFRRREQMRIIWRDLNRLSALEETTIDLSHMAGSCIEGAYRWLYDQCTPLWGVPMGAEADEEPWPQHLVVLGMGKLGAHELNLSSDIDLIFTYPCSGETQGGKRVLNNQEFFIRLGQKLIKALDAVTVDGFVFRVDMRLRPYGQSGALVLSFAAMEQYYQDQGRDWERYAMIKARVVAGDKVQGQDLMNMLRPFVYRRYIDFSAVEALRDMKRMIKREVKRKGLSNNIKLGAGGIREVEFIGQAFQLIHGGRELALQQRPILGVLTTLAEGGFMPTEDADELRQAYRFLRDVEHVLQALADQQTQDLPSTEPKQLRAALAMGFDDWPSFLQCLNEHRGRVDQHFAEVIADPNDDADEADDASSAWAQCWAGELSDEESLSLFSAVAYNDAGRAYQRIKTLRDSRTLQSVQRQGRERIDAFVPKLLTQLENDPLADCLLERLLPLVEAVLRRTAYLVLLMENPKAMEQLLRLCSISPWIADQIATHPMLLDEFLDLGSLYAPPDRIELAAELRQLLMRIPEEDLEQQMEALRYFKTSHVLRVAASEAGGSLPLMKVSDYLTWIAEVVLEEVVAIAWANLTARHGHPLGDDGQPTLAEFCIVGYGKLGGIELGYGSDLDMVFIHAANTQRSTDGQRSIDVGTFYARLGQRIIHILNTQTSSGQLYEVDMRLRPSGASGLLVSSLQSFESYQRKDAWTWEHQALTRARPLAGNQQVGAAFEAVRLQLLRQERDVNALRTEVVAMREKMRSNLGTKETQAGRAETAWQADSIFHLKHDLGGIVDIEFMVQYGVLAWSFKHPELARYTDNMRTLDALEATAMLGVEQADLLREAYKAFRSAAHRLALQNSAGGVSGDLFHDYRRGVVACWQALMEKD